MSRPQDKTQEHKALETLGILALFCMLTSAVLNNAFMLYAALMILFTGLFIRPAALFISKWWLKMAAALGIVNTKIILSVIFFLVLTPLAFVRRLVQGDMLEIKKPGRSDSLWKERNHQYTKEDLEKQW